MELEREMDKLISEHNTDANFFYDENVCEIIYVPVEHGKLKVYHHKPKKPIGKRPVLFLPGFGTSPWSWRHFSSPLFEKVEYYILESREKTSSKLDKRRRKAKMSIEQMAIDLGLAEEFLGLKDKDYVLFGSSFSGGIILTALLRQHLSPATVALHDPTKDWRVQRKLSIIFMFVPPFVVRMLRPILSKIVLAKMKNKAAKKRYQDFIKHGTVWKWRKTGIQNLKFNIASELKNIQQEILLFHGPKDRYHTDEEYLQMAKEFPNGRYFFMKSAPEFRELVVGISSLELAKITQNEQIPKSLAIFEIDLERKKE